jgi:thiol-disulfide isomerase/thioredoxin
MTTIKPLIALLALLLPSLALAQDDPEQILKNASDAIAGASGISMSMTLKGEGNSAMIAKTLPTLTARVTMGTHPDFARAIHMVGEFRPREDAESTAFDIVRSDDRLIWTDHDKQTVNIRPANVNIRQRPSVVNYMTMSAYLDQPPLQSVMSDAESIELEARQTVADTLCNVVLVTYPQTTGRSSRTYGQERWFIGTEDNLPRRIEQITDAGIVKASIVTEFPSVTIINPEPSDLDVFRPENYTVSDTLTQKPATRKPTTTPSTTPTTNRPQPSAEPTNPPAPPYTLTDHTGTEITNDTQSGRVTTLVFGGSWCVPCKELTPKLDDLVRELQGTNADIIYCAVRESDPQAVADNHTNAYTLVPETPAPVAAAFRIRIYPTVVVIDDDNTIALTAPLTRDTTPDELITQTRNAINQALNN